MPYNSEVLEKIAGLDASSDLSQEVRIGRYLLQDALSKNNTPLANAILNSVSKTIATSQLMDLRSARMLPASSVIFFARSLTGAVLKRLAEHGLSEAEIGLIAGELEGDVRELVSVVKERQLLTCDQPRGD